jgi:ribose 5-phosphate isomerase A
VSDPSLRAKQDAAVRAVDRVASGMTLGLGTGSTANLAIAEIGRRLASGALRDIVGVPSSVASEECARANGVPMTTLEQHPVIDLTIDGADEVDEDGNLLKGHGGALLREKIVASCSRRLVIAVDSSKLVTVLCKTRALPVEVVDFGWSTHREVLQEIGAEAELRLTTNGEPYRTDGGHYILDARFPNGIRAPQHVEATLCGRPGVVETGLFLGFSPEIIVGEP